MPRRATSFGGVLALVLAFPLAACSSEEGSDWSSVFGMAKDYFQGTPPISLEQAAAVPYASIGVRIGDSPQALLVLATQNGDDLLWVAGQSIAIRTHSGRIVSTSGLTHDLTRAVPGSLQGGTDWLVDFSDKKLYSIRVSCDRAPGISDPVTLLGKTIATNRVEETCQAPEIDWQFMNTFWVDPTTGFVWRSVQYIRPDLEPINIEVLRPPAQ